MLVDNFVDKIIHSSRTGDTEAVGKLIQGIEMPKGMNTGAF
jgi:hypothetical protein